LGKLPQVVSTSLFVIILSKVAAGTLTCTNVYIHYFSRAKDNNASAGGSKLVQLQRQSSAIGAGLPSLHSGSTSAFSGTPQPGLSAFLTSSDPLDDYGTSSGSKQGDSSTHNYGLGSFSSSSSSSTSAVSQQQQPQHPQHYQQLGGGSLSSGQQQQLSTGSEIHPLHFNWVFWFMHRAPGSRILNYESAMKRIASFGSVSVTL